MYSSSRTQNFHSKTMSILRSIQSLISWQRSEFHSPPKYVSHIGFSPNILASLEGTRTWNRSDTLVELYVIFPLGYSTFYERVFLASSPSSSFTMLAFSLYQPLRRLVKLFFFFIRIIFLYVYILFLLRD